MPRNYKRKTTRQSWSEVSMEKAIKEVLAGKMGYLKAAKIHGIPRSTLEDRIKKVRKGLLVEKASKKADLGAFRTVFSPKQEEELVYHILIMESRFFGFTMQELRTLAYEVAVRNGIGNKFDAVKKMAGKDWLNGFLKRHPELGSRTGEKKSPASATGFDRISVGNFFDLLGTLIEQYKFSPIDIYNVAEIGITTVPNKPSKIIPLRGSRQVGTSNSTDSEVLVTTVICISAAGVFMPGTFIFPCDRQDPTLLEDALPGWSAEYHETGSMQTDLFVKWFKRFVSFSNPSTEKPVLLLLDGQANCTKSLELINLAHESNVILLSYPPHCAQRMQPIDATFMRPLNTRYEQEVERWLSTHPGCYVTTYQVAKLFGRAFMNAAVMGTAINGFKETGIHPINPRVFPDHLFTTSDTTDGLVSPSDSTENFSNDDDFSKLLEDIAVIGKIESTSPQPSTSRHPSQESGLEIFETDRTRRKTQTSAVKREFVENTSTKLEKVTKKRPKFYRIAQTAILEESSNEVEQNL